MSDDLVATLHQAGHDYTDKAADLIKAQSVRIKSLDARIAELKTELKIWWDENVKNKIACQRKDDRIAELEAALDDALTYVWRAHGWSKLKPETQAYKFRKKE